MKQFSSTTTWLAGALAAFSVLVPQRSAAESLFALGDNNLLLRFESENPTLVVTQPIVGADPLVGLDLRPFNGALYGVSSTRRLYTIDLTTGTATAVSSTPFTTSTSGSSFGFDFNPTVDRIRIVNDAAENFRANPDTGTAIVDGTLAYAVGDPNFGIDPAIVNAAYDNNFQGTSVTALWVLDSRSDTLARQNPANSGVLTTIGGLGVNFTSGGGFDISGVTGRAYAALTSPGGAPTLYSVNLMTGAADSLGTIGYSGNVIGLVSPVPEPSTWAMLAIGAGAVAMLKRRRH